MSNRRIYAFQEIISTIATKISSKKPTLSDFTTGSNLRTIVEAYAHFVEFLQLQINVAFDSFFVGSAKGEDLDKRAADYNLKRKNAVNSYGVVTFKRNTPAPSTFVISEGAQVSTQPDVFGNTIDYLLGSDVTFPSGAVSVTGQVICTVPGIIGNQPSGAITNITSIIPGIDSVINQSAFTPGSDAETDEQLRKRIPIHINGLKTSNEDAVKAAALSIDGITVARIDEHVPSRGQFTVYISNQSGVLTNKQIEDVRKAVEDKAAFGIIANIAVPTVSYVTVSCDVYYNSVNYTQETISEAIKTAVYDFTSINPETSLKLVDLNTLIMSIPGVTNVKATKIDGVADDYEVSGFGAIRLADKYNSIELTFK